MICLTCKVGVPEPGFTTVTLERGDTIVVFKKVPAQLCPNCGEKYFDSTLTGHLLSQVQDAMKKAAEVEITHLQAA
jgi:YgiT-type zinc finger domain-containing protein